MKKILSALFLFFAVFSAVQAEEETYFTSPKDLTLEKKANVWEGFRIHFPRDEIDLYFHSDSTVVKTAEDFICPQPNDRFKKDFNVAMFTTDDTFTQLVHFEFVEKSVILHCQVIEVIDGIPSITRYGFNFQKIIDSRFFFDPEKVKEELKIVNNTMSKFSQAEEITKIIENGKDLDLKNTTSKYILQAITLDNSAINDELTRAHGRLVFNEKVPEASREFLSEELSAIYTFKNAIQGPLEELIWYIIGFVALFVGGKFGLEYVNSKISNTSDLQKEFNAKYVAFLIVGSVLLFPQPEIKKSNDGSMSITSTTTVAINTVSFFFSSLNSVYDKLGKIALDTIVSNQVQKAGLLSDKKIEEMVNKREDLNVEATLVADVANKLCSDINLTYNTQNNAYPIFVENYWGTLKIGEPRKASYILREKCEQLGAYYSSRLGASEEITRSLGTLTTAVPDCQACENVGELKIAKDIIDKQVKEFRSSYYNVADFNKLKSQILKNYVQKSYEEYENHGWVSLLWIVPTTYLFEARLQQHNLEEYEYLLDAHLSISSATSSLKRLIADTASTLPYIMFIPGGESVLKFMVGVGSVVPIVGEGAGALAGAYMLKGLGTYFLEIIPALVIIVVGGVYLFVWFSLTVGYLLATLVILPYALATSNVERISKFSKTLISHAFGPLKFIFSLIVLYSFAPLFKTVAIRIKEMFSTLVVDEQNWMFSIIYSVLGEVVYILQMVSIALISFWIVAKMGTIINEAIGGDKQDNAAEATTETLANTTQRYNPK